MSLAAIATAAASHQLSQPKKAAVNRPVLNMFSKPTFEADVVSQALFGATVTILETQGSWTRIATADDYPGWAESSALVPLVEGQSYGTGPRTATVSALAAHLYPVASVTRRAPSLTVPFESRLEVVEEPESENRRWLAVRLPDASRAWVQRGDIEFKPSTNPIPGLIELAKRFIGRPYTWGGTSSFGYDCSGFTQMLCRRGGVNIPRDAQPQAHWEQMAKVEKADLIPGDLLYFGSSLNKITHTGFYIGNGEFIHSTTHAKPILQISRLDEDHWTRLFVAARRWKTN